VHGAVHVELRDSWQRRPEHQRELGRVRHRPPAERPARGHQGSDRVIRRGPLGGVAVGHDGGAQLQVQVGAELLNESVEAREIPVEGGGGEAQIPGNRAE
jgi:hypothetical protein